MKTALTKKISLPKVSLRIVRETVKSYHVPTDKITGPEDIAKLLDYMTELPEERFVAVYCDVAMKPIAFQEISIGTVSASLVHPREVFKGALLNNASSIFVAHNHPAGTMRASFDDLETTEKLVSAGKLIGIDIVDHIILGNRSGDFLSIRENHSQYWR